MTNIDRLYSDRAGKMRKSEIRELLKVAQDPEVISFAGGLPSPSSFPIQEQLKDWLNYEKHWQNEPVKMEWM